MKTAADIRKQLDERHVTAREVVESFLSTIEKENNRLNAFLEVYSSVLDQADKAQEMIDKGEGGGLVGIPVALKDNLVVDGEIASSASHILENYRGVYDATVVDRLKKKGAVLLGRTNMDEFAMGSSTENSAFGVVHNPVDDSRVPGGSSGGSAAVVASGMAPLSLGSDTGGSIRQPAAFCGVVGFKPTYGAVSRYGLMALASSLDQIGPFAHSVDDAELLFNAIRGEDEMDATSIPEDVWKERSKKYSGITNPVVGVPRHLIEQEGIDDDVLENFNSSLDRLKEKGVEVVDIELPTADLSLATYYVIQPAEASSNLARYDGVKYGLHVSGESGIDDYFKTRAEGFGKETKRRILLGTYVLSAGYYDAYYGKALQAQKLITEEFTETFKKVHAVVAPTTPTPAFRIGEKANDPLAMYLSDIFTVPANIAGIPAISIPSGTVNREGIELPLGFQVMGPRYGDQLVFDIARLL